MREEEENASTIQLVVTVIRLTSQTTFIESYYERYMESTKGQILRLWEGSTNTPERI
jgi:hypothetical protein